MLRQTRIACLLGPLLLIAIPGIGCAADAVLQVFDGVCEAPIIAACVHNWPSKAPPVSYTSDKPQCPLGYTVPNAPNVSNCYIDGVSDGAAISGRYLACKFQVEADGRAQSCVRNVPVAQLLSAQQELNGTLLKDMRNLLSQFCETYATTPGAQTKCSAIAPPDAGASSPSGPAH